MLPLEMLFISKLNNQLGLPSLVFKAMLAKKIREKLTEWDDPMLSEERGISQDGLEAEKITCNYYDSLISCMDPVGKECWQKSLIHPYKKTWGSRR